MYWKSDVFKQFLAILIEFIFVVGSLRHVDGKLVNGSWGGVNGNDFSNGNGSRNDLGSYFRNIC
jgi:hypothetical protein